jgi:hypothetical protein
LPCAPPLTVHAPFCCLRPPLSCRLSLPCAPLPYAPPEYKFHKVVVHSITWASGPLTTERWLTAGCLGGDHSFYIHSHSHAQGCGCMHVRCHVIFLFIVNACQLGSHIKLLAVGEQTGGPTLTDTQHRKIERDKTRVRSGNVQRCRVQSLCLRKTLDSWLYLI